MRLGVRQGQWRSTWHLVRRQICEVTRRWLLLRVHRARLLMGVVHSWGVGKHMRRPVRSSWLHHGHWWMMIVRHMRATEVGWRLREVALTEGLGRHLMKVDLLDGYWICKIRSHSLWLLLLFLQNFPLALHSTLLKCVFPSLLHTRRLRKLLVCHRRHVVFKWRFLLLVFLVGRFKLLKFYGGDYLELLLWRWQLIFHSIRIQIDRKRHVNWLIIFTLLLLFCVYYLLFVNVLLSCGCLLCQD